jgi:hypothetical protein
MGGLRSVVGTASDFVGAVVVVVVVVVTVGGVVSVEASGDCVTDWQPVAANPSTATTMSNPRPMIRVTDDASLVWARPAQTDSLRVFIGFSG